MDVGFVRCESFEGDDEHEKHKGQQGECFGSSSLHVSAQYLIVSHLSHNYAVVPGEVSQLVEPCHKVPASGDVASDKDPDCQSRQRLHVLRLSMEICRTSVPMISWT